MRSTWLALVACLVCGVVSLACWSVAARAEEPSPSTAMSLTGDALIVPGSSAFSGGQQAAAEEVRRASPEAVAERAVSLPSTRVSIAVLQWPLQILILGSLVLHGHHPKLKVAGI